MLDFLLAHAWQAWLLISFALLLLELTSGDFFLLCLSMAAAVSFIFAACGMGWVGQLLVFAVAAVLTLGFVRPNLLRRMYRRAERQSNADAIIGREGRVSEAIADHGFGRVAIDGDDWKAKTASGAPVALGKRVSVVARESLVVTVEEVADAPAGE